MSSDHYIEDCNLSAAWGRALLAASARGLSETGPLIVSVTGFDKAGLFQEDVGVRTALDDVLQLAKKQSVETVANTIFPASMWNPAASRSQLFDRYRRIAERLREASRKNQRGIYFDRMISGGPPGKENQLEFALSTYNAKPGMRRSILQIGVFNPGLDHSGAAQLGFPCLQHVTFAPIAGGLCVNAFYATQYMLERAYGNYVGICRLGHFVAHELGLRLTRMTCFTGVAKCEVRKRELAQLIMAIKSTLGQEGRSGPKP